MKERSIIQISISLGVITSVVLSVIIYVVIFRTENEPEMTVKPVVISTDKLYNTSNYHNSGWTSIHATFREIYSKTATSKLQKKLVEKTLEKSETIGEDPYELAKCLNCIQYIRENTAWHIPCYVEKSFFEYHLLPDGRVIEAEYVDSLSIDNGPVTYIVESCWFIVLNERSKGDMGHYSVYFISIEDKEIIYNNGCN